MYAELYRIRRYRNIDKKLCDNMTEDFNFKRVYRIFR